MKFLRLLFICVALGISVGVASAVFLLSLDFVTRFRVAHSGLFFLLPAGGFALGWIYHRWGREVEGGSNLILDEIHSPRAAIPPRLAPLVFLGTLWTHFFGGSAGREGTAVQMGGSIADLFTKPFRLIPAQRRTLLMVGMSAGFASVFGVPLAGTVFGLEVLSSGRRLEWRKIPECLTGAFVAHFVCLACGVHHTVYSLPVIPPLSIKNMLEVAAVGAIFGGTAWLFSGGSHWLRGFFVRRIKYAPLRPAVGGAILLLGFAALGTTRFAGLGIPVLQSSLNEVVPTWDFAWKMAFTAVTLSSGFKGGEVTPLLFIGATLGNALSMFFPLHFSFLAAIGFVAVFAGAAKTPWACALMGMEIFGPSFALWGVIACVISHLSSGHTGIYSGQRRG